MGKKKTLAESLREAGAIPPRLWGLRPDVLTYPTNPPPLHGLVPRIILGKKWWDETRRKAYESTDFCCIACGLARYTEHVHQLEGHEVYEIDFLMGRSTYVETVPLCPYCHGFIHQGRLRILVSEGKLDEAQYQRIIEYGRSILRKHKLVKAIPYAGPTVDPDEWCLIVFGKEYPACPTGPLNP